MTRLSIAHVTDSLGVYGAESVLLDLCDETRRAGHVPVLLSIGLPSEAERPVERAALERDIKVVPVRMRSGPNLAGARRLVAAAIAEHADVFHTHGYKGDILLALLPRRVRRLPLVATVHGYTNVHWFDRQLAYRRADAWALQRADRVVLVHQGMTSQPGLNRLHDFRWRVIENGVGPMDDREPLPDDDDVLRRCRAAGPVVGAIGRLSKEKGFDLLLRAIAPVLQSRPESLLVIIGEGPERPALEQLVGHLGLSRQVVLAGYRKAARLYLKLFDLFVLSSLTEGLPITILEAMQSRVPIVATRVGGVPHVLDEGQGGRLVAPGDPRALHDAIGDALDDRATSTELAEHAWHQAEIRFTSRAMAARYLELYREVATH